MESQDETLMQLALEEARRGYGTTSPNPPVGAVIVQGGEIIGRGYHEQAGQPHAERRALADARARGNEGKLAGATIYVTLEPCSTYGKTPPCTEAIIEAGIKRVVYGAVDPDKRHQGRADALLRAAGIEVTAGVCQAACERLLRAWSYAVTNRRPWVTAKVACTLDASMTRRDTPRISSAESTAHAHQLRLESDAVLIGGNTLRTDNPALTIRTPQKEIPACKKQPWRIVLTRDKKSLPPSARLFTDEHADRTLVFEQVSDWENFLHTLYRDYGIVNLMTECGGALLKTLLEAGVINEWVQDIAPILSGGELPVLPGDFLATERRLEIETQQNLGGNIVLRGVLK